jgi:Family of unknown function (DUF6011)
MTQTTIQIKEPKAPATLAQINFLESLIKERECPTVAERYAFAKGFLTKGAASTLIGEAKAAPKKAPATGTFVVAEIPATQTPKVPAAEPVLDGCPAFGYYEIDGTLYYWDVTGKDVKPTLRRLSVVTNYDGSKKGSWKKVYGGQTAFGNGTSTKAQKVEATYTPYAGKGYQKIPQTSQVWVPGVLVAGVLAGAQPMTSAEAGAIGKKMTFCIRCGATLTDPHSVANGIGPVCITYWS